MNKRAPLMGLLWDIGLPAAAYYVCRGAGVEARTALIAGGVVAVARVGLVAVTRRRLDGLGALVVAGFAVMLAVSMLTGDPRILLARESLVSGSIGVVLLGSGLLGRPVLYSLVQRLNSGRGEGSARLEEPLRTRPAFRRFFVVMSIVWGAGLVTEAVVRIAVIYLLPVDAATGASTLLQVGAIALLGGWSLWYRRRWLGTVAGAPVGKEASHAR